jgi:hypothetical protein
LQQFFVNVDEADLDIEEEAIGLDPSILTQQSITKFLMLPTVTASFNPKKQDPIVNFTKSIILISNFKVLEK